MMLFSDVPESSHILPFTKVIPKRCDVMYECLCLYRHNITQWDCQTDARTHVLLWLQASSSKETSSRPASRGSSVVLPLIVVTRAPHGFLAKPQKIYPY